MEIEVSDNEPGEVRSTGGSENRLSWGVRAKAGGLGCAIGIAFAQVVGWRSFEDLQQLTDVLVLAAIALVATSIDIKDKVDELGRGWRVAVVPAIVVLALTTTIMAVTRDRTPERQREAAGDLTDPLNGDQILLPAGDAILAGRDREHHVSLEPFRIELEEVSNRRYQMCVEDGVCDRPVFQTTFGEDGADNLPVTGVSAVQAQTFCQWIGRSLPSELQWVRAARGTDGRPFPWEAPGLPTLDHATLFFVDQNGNQLVSNMEPTRVDSNDLGGSAEHAVNLLGNVWEWTTTTPAASDARWEQGGSTSIQWLASQASLILRGRSYKSLYELGDADEAARLMGSAKLWSPGRSDDDIGFRCVEG